MVKILVVEDDLKLNQIVCNYLNDNGYKTISCLKVEEAYDEMNNNIFDLIISDIMMPQIDGFEFARSIRDINSNIPILFMSALDDIETIKKGYQLEIDDYMIKPVNLDELVLRVEALLRRANIANEKQIVVGNLTLDVDAISATVDEKEVAITLREFNILYKLLSYPKKTFSRGELMDEFWGIDSDTSLRAVDVYITKLRDKFANCYGFKIVTVHGLGYKVILNEKN